MLNHSNYLRILALVSSIACIGSVSADTENLADKLIASSPMLQPTVALTKLYDNHDSRYSIKYPANWIYDKAGKGAVTFSGDKNTPEYFSTINIQTVLTKKSGGDFSNSKDFMADVMSQALKESPQASFVDSGPFAMTLASGIKIDGQFLTFVYNYQGKMIKQWQIVVLRNDANVFYTWAYTAPANQYEHDLGIAKEMLKSWVIY